MKRLNRTTYLVALPIWALDTLINFPYRKKIYKGLTREQSRQMNDFINEVDPNGYGFICHVPEEEDQPNTSVIPAFGGLTPSAICYFSIYHD